ncbi:response regulator [Cohnella sp. GCM10020058]|uniref:response regulator transcription factor n=1 Tax=Cohnella sp. GCM10020058 TaxID=3317330 RepID=UPI00363C825B
MYKLLLVDDEAEAREALSLYFPWHELGFEVAGQAGNGREALDMIALQGNIDIVLTDIRMPVMNGIELAEAIHERKLDIEVLFLSSYREFEYAQKALKYRVKNYIVKPAKYQMLMDVFSELKAEMSVSRRAEETAGLAVQTRIGEEGLIMSKIKAFLQEHYRTATLEEAAKLVHMNANYLSYLFKQKIGVNFTDYLIRVKMEVALRLLADVRYKTYEISEMVGYSNAKNFTRTFKSYYGKTPSEYRNGFEQR